MRLDFYEYGPRLFLSKIRFYDFYTDQQIELAANRYLPNNFPPLPAMFPLCRYADVAASGATCATNTTLPDYKERECRLAYYASKFEGVRKRGCVCTSHFLFLRKKGGGEFEKIFVFFFIFLILADILDALILSDFSK